MPTNLSTVIRQYIFMLNLYVCLHVSMHKIAKWNDSNFFQYENKQE